MGWPLSQHQAVRGALSHKLLILRSLGRVSSFSIADVYELLIDAGKLGRSAAIINFDHQRRRVS